MEKAISLSHLLDILSDHINNEFEGKTYLINAEIVDVKKYPQKRWCFLKFIDKIGSNINSEIKGVFWGRTYHQIENFEEKTKTEFKDGIEINCRVKISFHQRYGLSLEVLEINIAHTIGQAELERQKTLEKLLKENPQHIKLKDEEYFTSNKKLKIPRVIEKIALCAAPNSDGLRDFLKELLENDYGYGFEIKLFPVSVQGDLAAKSIINQLEKIHEKPDYDLLVIVRGGGSQTDLKAFDDYNLANMACKFPIPILSGIGHDRNTSILDLMVRQLKTPTKVASFIVNQNYNYEADIKYLEEKIINAADRKLRYFESGLNEMKRVIENLNPQKILNKGFALLSQNGKIISDSKDLKVGQDLEANIKYSKILLNIKEIEHGKKEN